VSSSLRALRTRNYRLWVSGTVVSNIGTWVQRTSQDWLVLTVLTDHSGLATGVTTGLQFVPLMLFSIHAGVLADRLPKRKVLLCTQSVMGLSALVLGLLVVTDTVQLWEVFACALLLGCGTAVDNPARQSFVSEVVARADVPSAVSLNSASMNTARLIGPGLAGLIIAAWGTGPGFLINAASFASVIVALLRMRPNEMFVSDRPPRAKGQVREGLAYVRSRPDLMLILASTSVIGTFAFNWQVTSALMASGTFHRGPREYGLLGSTMAIGCLAAAFLGARRDHPRIQMVGYSGLGLGLLMVVGGLAPYYALYAIALVPIGLFAITYVTTSNTSIQLSTPAVYRGRVIALYVVLQQGTAPIGAPLVGWLGSEFGARWSVLSGGGTAVVAGGVGLWLMHRRPAIARRYAEELEACSRESVTAPESTAPARERAAAGAGEPPATAVRPTRADGSVDGLLAAEGFDAGRAEIDR
jgi:MFS family permease